jgi:hypothetical protein
LIVGKQNDGIWKAVYVNGEAFRWTAVARAPTALNQSFLHILELSQQGKYLHAIVHGLEQATGEALMSWQKTCIKWREVKMPDIERQPAESVKAS